jgi:hypothetical protein
MTCNCGPRIVLPEAGPAMLGDVLATLDRDWEMPDAVIKPV